MILRTASIALSVAGILVVQACHTTTGANRTERVAGIIDFYADASSGVLAAPDTVQAGADVQVTITTFGGGCEQVGGADVSRNGTTVTVAVYDFTEAHDENVACPDILRRFPRTATIRFPDAGTGTLRIVGRRLGPETDWRGVPTVIDKQIVVR